MKNNILKLSILLILIVSLMCSCSIINKPDSGDENGTGNIETPDGGSTDVGDNNDNQPENSGTPDIPDDNTPENPDNGNDGGENSGNNNKPNEPDPDAGKNGIDEILLAFGDYKANDGDIFFNMKN